MKPNRLVFGMMAAALAAHAQAAPAPFASGSSGSLKWEARFNLPVCNHPGQAPGAWCTIDDIKPSAEVSGVEHRLEELMNEPSIKSVTMAYFSFSNKNVRRALCKAAKERDLKVTLYIDQSSLYGVENVEELKKCSKNVRVVGLGAPFGTEGGYLQHMKIFMASPMDKPAPLADVRAKLSKAEYDALRKTRTTVTSSSANMSSFGTNIHLENWLFLESDTQDFVIQANTCVFKGLEEASKKKAAEQRQRFVDVYTACREKIQTQERADLRFFAVPHGGRNPQPFLAMKDMVNRAKRTVLVAIHRLTTAGITRLFTNAARRGLDVKVVMDDDSLRTGKVNGGHAHDVGPHDVKSHRDLTASGADVRFMQTNADSVTHLHHNKFIVVDPGTSRQALFQGAGNFTSSSLNMYDYGNFEHFYAITIPAIVSAYERAHDELYARATAEKDHPVGKNKDKKLVIGQNGMVEFEGGGSWHDVGGED